MTPLRSHFRYSAYQIFPLQFKAEAKLQLWICNKRILWLGGITTWVNILKDHRMKKVEKLLVFLGWYVFRADFPSSPSLSGTHPGEEWLSLYVSHCLPAIPHQRMGSNEISPNYGDVPTGFVIV